MLRTLLPLAVVLASLASSASAQTIGLKGGNTTLLPVSCSARVAIALGLDLRDAKRPGNVSHDGALNVMDALKMIARVCRVADT